jgi:light-regulated signal transduction histidine kinase (bacteriophytochrome)
MRPGTISQTISSPHHLGQPGIHSRTLDAAITLIMPVGFLGVLMALFVILFVAAVPFAAIAARRKDATEAATLRLTKELDETGRAAEQMTQHIAELEARVAELTGQLEAATKEAEAFSYTVAHDLRAPLRHISGFSKILMDNYSSTLDATAQNYLRFVCGGAKNMGQLIDDLLTMGRIGRQELVPRPTDLNQLVDGTVASLQKEYEGREIDWKIGKLPSVECDPALVKQVFANLLSNAVKYTRPRKKASIEIGRLTTDGAPTIFVRDNGTGFDQRYAHKLFGVFQRLHTPEQFEGTGVGLATTQRIILRHGGRIWAEAEVDKGATFFFTLTADGQGPPKNGTKSSAKGEP